jgi:hypothetical protein
LAAVGSMFSIEQRGKTQFELAMPARLALQ